MVSTNLNIIKRIATEFSSELEPWERKNGACGNTTLKLARLFDDKGIVGSVITLTNVEDSNSHVILKAGGIIFDYVFNWNSIPPGWDVTRKESISEYRKDGIVLSENDIEL